jgi:hypothetical protein
MSHEICCPSISRRHVEVGTNLHLSFHRVCHSVNGTISVDTASYRGAIHADYSCVRIFLINSTEAFTNETKGFATDHQTSVAENKNAAGPTNFDVDNAHKEHVQAIRPRRP